MFKVWLTNFGYALAGEHCTIYDALMHGRSCGYEFSIIDEEGHAVGFCEGVSLQYTGLLH